jgi:hypothetical protein
MYFDEMDQRADKCGGRHCTVERLDVGCWMLDGEGESGQEMLAPE